MNTNQLQSRPIFRWFVQTALNISSEISLYYYWCFSRLTNGSKVHFCHSSGHITALESSEKSPREICMHNEFDFCICHCLPTVGTLFCIRLSRRTHNNICKPHSGRKIIRSNIFPTILLETELYDDRSALCRWQCCIFDHHPNSLFLSS